MGKLRTILTIALLGTATLMTATAPVPAAAADSATPDFLPPPPASRTITIDGRTYTVTLQVLRFTPGAKPEEGDPTTVTVTSRIFVQDGAALPQGLTLSRVRMERFFGTSRVFFAKLTPDNADQTSTFELADRFYRGDVTSRTKGVRRLKATVRVELDGRVFPVNFGSVPVSSAGLFP